jgi:hypothetical protein
MLDKIVMFVPAAFWDALSFGSYGVAIVFFVFCGATVISDNPNRIGLSLKYLVLFIAWLLLGVLFSIFLNMNQRAVAG